MWSADGGRPKQRETLLIEEKWNNFMSKYESLDESDISNLIKSGDTKAFEFIYFKYNAKITNSLLGKCRNPHLADEIAQIAWTKAWRKFDQFHGDSKIYTWVYRIATNAFFDYFKKHKRESFIEDLEAMTNQPIDNFRPPDTINKLLSPSEDLEKREEHRHIKRLIDKLIKKLPKDKRHVANLVLQQGMSYEQASKKTKSPVGTVMSRIFYARKSMQKQLKKEIKNGHV